MPVVTIAELGPVQPTGASKGRGVYRTVIDQLLADRAKAPDHPGLAIEIPDGITRKPDAVVTLTDKVARARAALKTATDGTTYGPDHPQAGQVKTPGIDVSMIDIVIGQDGTPNEGKAFYVIAAGA